MKNKLLIILVAILLISNSFAQDEIISTSEIQSQFSDPSIKLSFHSWGEGEVTEIQLDEYFAGERQGDDRYLFVAPPEIEVIIDQETGIASLKAGGKWLGTLDIIFTRSNIYNLESSI